MTLRTRIALFAIALASIVIFGVMLANAADLNVMTPAERAEYWQRTSGIKHEHRADRRHAAHDANANIAGRATTDRGCLTSDTLSVLNRAEAHFGVTFKIVSTCRPGAKIRNTKHESWHAHNRAVDFIVPRGTSKAAVVKWLFDHASGVTMTYRRMAHVHFDTGNYHKLACGGCGGGRHYSARSRHHRYAARR